ncbi:MAG: hypothetical protein IJ317_04680 [Clostridia bacterium]|nr:hypothetical protein [Clostridia bacterium]
MEKEYKSARLDRENETLERLWKLEDLAAKKAGIYSKLLTEQSLAENMQEISARHTARNGALERLLFGEKSKETSKNGGENNEA